MIQDVGFIATRVVIDLGGGALLRVLQAARPGA